MCKLICYCISIRPSPYSLPPEPNKDIQRLLRSSSSGDLSKELFHHPFGDEEAGGLSGHTASLLHVKERRREYRGKEGRPAQGKKQRVQRVGLIEGLMDLGRDGWMSRWK